MHRLEALRASTRKTVIFGVSGSVATIKANVIAKELLDSGINVVLLPTKSAQHFIEKCGPEYSMDQIKRENGLNENNKYDKDKALYIEFVDQDEWDGWNQRNDPVLHIELRKLADLLLISPLSANTMAKVSNGLSDNLLTSVFRCWDFKNKKPLLLAPAMNTLMYESPITGLQEKVL